MLLIREELCDKSKYCWFLANCKHKVVSFNDNGICIANDKCKMCRECVGHCDVAVLYTTDEEKQAGEANLAHIQRRFNDNEDVFGAEPYNQANVIFGENCCEQEHFEKAISKIRSNNNLQLIELIYNGSLICRVAGVPYYKLFNDIREIIAGKYNDNQVDHEIIYTANNEQQFKQFLEFFGIGNDKMKDSPFLVFYYKKQVLGVFGHGPIHYKRYSAQEIREEIRTIMENL